ncbi:hypothetical protein CfE428DRAFT_0661 [Chthoniobacter flavus Ellin428]|uniref:Uncharacterized protein n=1 Tax=Chthoniobacter flavus Ellin428 TaxID=497964 RepID=B4CVH4_9BACT|nr:hypothetical protein CfE428DRAFT_0661 [Chthoniobacter flavus Ellin428]
MRLANRGYRNSLRTEKWTTDFTDYADFLEATESVKSA